MTKRKAKSDQELTVRACEMADNLMQFAERNGYDMLQASVAFAIAAASCCRGGGKTEAETVGMMRHFAAGVYAD